MRKKVDLIGKVNTDQTKRIGFHDKEKKQAVELVNKINRVIRENKNKSLVCTHSNGTKYDFNKYRDVNQFGNDLYNGELLIDDARNEQYEMQILINKLKSYDTRNKRKKIKDEVVANAKKLYNIRNDIINTFDQINRSDATEKQKS